MFPKSQKLTPTPGTLARQDTIDETNEDSKSLRRQALERQASERDGEHLEKASSIEREIISSSARTTASASDTYDNGLREQSNAMAQRDLIATVLDLKVDSRLEMQRMSQRIGRLEDLLTELVKRMSTERESSDLSTPADETIPTITTTFVGSPPATSATAQPSNIYITATPSTSTVSAPPSTSATSIQPSSSGKMEFFLLFPHPSPFRKQHFHLHLCLFLFVLVV